MTKGPARGAVLALAFALGWPAPAAALSSQLPDPEPEPAAGASEPPPDVAAPPPAATPAAPAPTHDRWAAEPDLYADEEPEPDDPWAPEPDLYADEDPLEDDVVTGFGIPEPDPFESVNRKLLVFNDGVDRFVLDPASTAYTFIMPDVAERAVLRVFSNLNSPVILVNDVFQLEFKRAGVTLSRLVVNSTVGLAGILDVAEKMGLEGHENDFGQTLARLGVGSGPYIVIPILGPSTVRDAIGFGVDLFFRPLFWLIGPFDFLLVGTGNGFVVRASYMEELQALRESSVDYYATLRNAYFQRRAEQLRAGGVAVAVSSR